MLRTAGLAILALATMAPSSAMQSGGNPGQLSLAVVAGESESSSPNLDLFASVRRLSGFALADALDELVLSYGFWRTCNSIVRATPELQTRDPRQIARASVNRAVTELPTIPLALQLRALFAAAVVMELRLPETDSRLVQAATESEDSIKELIVGISDRLDDQTEPVAIRRAFRIALRGIAAIVVLSLPAAEEPDSDITVALATAYAEGMEQLARLVALELQGPAAERADQWLLALRIPPFDRNAVAARRDEIAQAASIMASTKDYLQDGPLRLPPDEGLNSSSTTANC